MTVFATMTLEFTREGVKLSDPSRESATELLYITAYLLLSILPYSLRFEDHFMRISGQQISFFAETICKASRNTKFGLKRYTI